MFCHGSETREYELKWKSHKMGTSLVIQWLRLQASTAGAGIQTLVQFSSVQSLSRVRLFATPWITARQASLSITNPRSPLKLMSIESIMPSSHLSSLGSVIFSMLFPVWQTRPQPIKREGNKYHQVERFPRQDLEIEQVTYSRIPLAGTQLHGHISLQRKREKSRR